MSGTTLESTLLLIAKINKVLSLTSSKDRVIRMIQYLMKFLTFSMSIGGAAKARKVELLLIDARKVFRFLRFLESFANFQKIWVSNKRTSLPLRALQLVQHGSLFAFFLSDHALLLSKLSITSHDPVWLRQVFGGVWLTSCISGAGADLLRLRQLRTAPYSGCANAALRDVTDSKCEIIYEGVVGGESRISEGQHSEDRDRDRERRGWERARLENGMDLVLNVLNAYVALNLSKKDMPHHRGVVGACGMLTSGIQLWQILRNYDLKESLATRLEVPSQCCNNKDKDM
jgi:hypothetical protein